MVFVKREQFDENRETLLATASKLFRERGIDGVGVAEIAREAGLTHGALYAHFRSKEALATEAFSTGLALFSARLLFYVCSIMRRFDWDAAGAFAPSLSGALWTL